MLTLNSTRTDNIHGNYQPNNLASTDCLIMPQPNSFGIDMTPPKVRDYQNESINDDLRNFAKSSTNLPQDSFITLKTEGLNQDQGQSRFLKKEKVAF